MPRTGLTPARVVGEAAVLADAEGFDAVTLAALAARLEVRVPSLYKHVDGLAEVQRQVALDGLRGMTDAVGAATVGLAGREALAAACAAYTGYARRHPGRYAAIQRAPDPGDTQRGELSDRLVGLMVDVLRGYAFDQETAIHAVRIVRSALHGFVALEQAGGFALPLDLEETFRRLVDVLDAGLTALQG